MSVRTKNLRSYRHFGTLLSYSSNNHIRYETCYIEIDWCSSNPCHHNGSCVSIKYGYYCHCITGWVGRQCDHDIDECMWSTCPTGSSCQNVKGGYHCLWQSKRSKLLRWRRDDERILGKDDSGI
jgi:hypothetical protein